MLHFIYSAIAVVGLVGLSGGLVRNESGPSVWTTPQIADGTDPTAPPFPLGPQVADGTDPTAPPFPLAA